MSAKLEFDAVSLAKGIYIEAKRRKVLQISCNWCPYATHIFYEGEDYHASMRGRSWLADAAQHLLEKHSDKS